jgi:hypothetical protein
VIERLHGGADPLQDGMFAMEQAWHVFFTHKSDEARATAMVTVPAHGSDAITVEVQTYGVRRSIRGSSACHSLRRNE